MTIIPSFIISTSLFFCSPKFQTALFTQWENKTIATPVWFISTAPFPFLQVDFGTITQQGVVGRANPGTLEISNSTTFSESTNTSYSINHPQEASVNTKPIAFASTLSLGPSLLSLYAEIPANAAEIQSSQTFNTISTSFLLPLNFKSCEWLFATAIQNYKTDASKTDVWYTTIPIHDSAYLTSVSAETSFSTFFLRNNKYESSQFRIYLGGTIAEQNSSIPKGLFRINTHVHTPFGGISLKAFCCDFGFTSINGTSQNKTINLSVEPQICIPFLTTSETNSITINTTGTFYFKPSTNSTIDGNTINTTLLIAMQDCQKYMAFSAATIFKKHGNTITFSASMQDILFTKNYLLLTDKASLVTESDIKIKFSFFDLNIGMLALLEPESILQVIEHTYKIGISSRFINATAKSTIADAKIESWNIEIIVPNIYGFTIESSLTNQGNFKLKLNYLLKLLKKESPLAKH